MTETASVRVCVADRDGLHARPAARIAETALASGCDVRLTARGCTVSALSIFEMLGLSAPQGETVLVEAEGAGAAACVRAVAAILASPRPGS